MDRIIRAVGASFIIILVIFAALGLHGAYIEQKYRNSLVSTYSYTLTISTSERLSNVTFFIPVPELPGGSSPFIDQFSKGTFTGIPAGWETTLLGSEKATMLKITTPSISGSDGAGFSVRISADERTARLIRTGTPQKEDMMLRPVQAIREVSCSELTGASEGATCYKYQSAVYADYESSPDARVEISSTISGENEWNISVPAFNRYSDTISVMMLGGNNGWVVAKGELQAGIGSYDVPAI